MIQNVLQHIGGIANYGVISICLFVTVFLGVVLWAALLRKSHLETMSRLPLERDETESAGRSAPAPQPPTRHE